MRNKLYKSVAPLAACLLVMAMCQVGAARPFFGSGCTSAGCHTNPGGDLTITPDPLKITVDGNGVAMFNIVSNPDRGAIALTGLDAAGLDVQTVGGGWTDGGGYFYSNIFSGTAPYTLDLGLGPAAVEGLYGVGVTFAGQPGFWSGTYDFGVNVIPEPASLALVFSGFVAVGLVTWRRRRAG